MAISKPGDASYEGLSTPQAKSEWSPRAEAILNTIIVTVVAFGLLGQFGFSPQNPPFGVGFAFVIGIMYLAAMRAVWRKE